MQSLIKWPGGKTSEYDIIRRYIPEYNRYIEPFFGGGAVFFNMQPQAAIINDISVNLMNFYRFIKSQNARFKYELYSINDDWEKLKIIANSLIEGLTSLYKLFRIEKEYESNIKQEIERCCIVVADAIIGTSVDLNNKNLFLQQLRRTLNDKIFRTRRNEEKNHCLLSDDDLHDNILTGFTGGYYMFMRDKFNKIENGDETNYTEEYKISIFYFIREFCYGSMYRYNSKGEFNIPYGGIAYNNKDFKKKIDILFSQETYKYLENATIYNKDFEEILKIAEEDDFIFLDPPYDTNFSNYENRTFDEHDQRRLAKCLHETKAKFLLIIKNTQLISELYKNNGYRVYAFDNKYSYCVKGRNDRNAVHLIVTNYD